MFSEQRLPLVLATANRGKIEEITEIFEGLPLTISTLFDYSGLTLPPETGDSFEANARLKARFVTSRTGKAAMADDSGLEVHYLQGRPGIYSARYAGPDCSSEANNELLLKELSGVPDELRGARFVAVLVLTMPSGEEILCRGECSGRIAEAPSGRHGFGYDPLFVPDGYDRTFADLGPQVKRRRSHRAAALRLMASRIRQMMGE